MKKRELVAEQQHNELAEKQVLGRLLDNQSLLNGIFNPLNEKYFVKPIHKFIFNAVKSLVDNNADVGNVSVYELVSKLINDNEYGGFQYIVELEANIAWEGTEKENMPLLSSLYVFRQLTAFGMEVAAAASTRNYLELDSVLDTSYSRLSEICDNRYRKKGLKILSEVAVKEMHAIFEDSDSGKVTQRGLLTGISALDIGLVGLLPGDVTVIAGATSMGKSSLAAFIALNMAKYQGTRIGIITLEMRAEELVLRMVSSLSGVPLYKISTATFNATEHENLTSILNNIKDLFIVLDDGGKVEIGEYEGRVRHMIKKHKIDILIVDYLQLVKNKNRTENSNQKVTEISNKIKEVALSENIHTILLSQLSRKLSDRGDNRPVLSDLRDSGSIEQDASNVIFINRPARLGDENSDDSKATIWVMKNRNGAVFNFDLLFTGETYTFTETL